MQSVLDYSVTVQAVSGVDFLTPAEAKAHSRIDLDADDTLLSDYLTRARIQVERDTRRSFVQHTYDFKYDRFPCDRYIRFSGYSPLSSITHLKYYDTDGTLQTWSSSNYEVDTARDTVWLAFNVDWPSIRDIQNAVQIRAVFGHSATDEEAELAKQAVLLLTSHWYFNREAVLIGSVSKDIELSYNALIEGLAKRSYP